MEKLIFACMASRDPGLDFHVPLFAKSIRTFGGILSDCPLWVFVPESEHEISKKLKDHLESLGVKIILYEIDADIMKFPFAGYVRAAATAESLAKEKAACLAWMGMDTLIVNEPTHLLLDSSKIMGYRPVHHTLIGSIYENPVDLFWELIYDTCHVSNDKIFPMHTHVDHNILRPYFNAGYVIVRPEKGLLVTWWDYFKKLYKDPSFEEYYTKNNLYSIFMHQAVLAGVILSMTEKKELQELPFTYNYPLHLYDESPPDLRPQNVSDLITVRYETLNVLETFSFDNPLRSWLNNELNSFSNSNL
ncbi:MAG: hypothetical protein PVF58_01045 [Candidatus Methanofastidiosia archaeon]|jgi:hypothetical protein